MNIRILVPLDGSPLSEQVIPSARKLATNLAPCTIALFCVIDPATLAGPGDGAYLLHGIERGQKWAQEYLDKQAEQLRSSGIEVETAVSIGPPASVILNYIQANDFDYVMMATHGRSGLARAIVGSVTDRVIREAAIPVIAVHPRPPQSEASNPWPGDEAAAADLIKMFARSDLLSSQAVDVLAKRGAAVVPELVGALSSERSEVRRYAARTLGAIGTTEMAVDALVDCITDEALEVRWEAEEALVRFGAVGVQAVLESLTHRTADARYNLAVMHVLDRAPMDLWQALKPVIHALHGHESAMTAPIEADRALRKLRQPRAAAAAT